MKVEQGVCVVPPYEVRSGVFGTTRKLTQGEIYKLLDMACDVLHDRIAVYRGKHVSETYELSGNN